MLRNRAHVPCGYLREKLALGEGRDASLVHSPPPPRLTMAPTTRTRTGNQPASARKRFAEDTSDEDMDDKREDKPSDYIHAIYRLHTIDQ